MEAAPNSVPKPIHDGYISLYRKRGKIIKTGLEINPVSTECPYTLVIEIKRKSGFVSSLC